MVNLGVPSPLLLASISPVPDSCANTALPQLPPALRVVPTWQQDTVSLPNCSPHLPPHLRLGRHSTLFHVPQCLMRVITQPPDARTPRVLPRPHPSIIPSSAPLGSPPTHNFRHVLPSSTHNGPSRQKHHMDVLALHLPGRRAP